MGTIVKRSSALLSTSYAGVSVNPASIAVEPERLSGEPKAFQMPVSEGVLFIGMLAGELPSPYTHDVIGGEKKVLTIDENTFDLLQEQFSLSEMQILNLRDDYRRSRNDRCRVRATLQRARDGGLEQ